MENLPAERRGKRLCWRRGGESPKGWTRSFPSLCSVFPPLPRVKNPTGFSWGGELSNPNIRWCGSRIASLLRGYSPGTAPSVQRLEFRGGILQSADRAGIMQGMAEGACSHSLSAMNSLPEEAWAEISALQVPLAGKRSFGQPQTPKTTAVQGKGSFRGSLGLPFSPQLMDGSCLVCAAPRSKARGSAAPRLVPFDGVCVFQASGILARREGGTRRIPCLGWDGAGEFKL